MIVMGRVLAPYGVEGWLKARAFTATPGALLAQPRWWLGKEDGVWDEFVVTAARQHSGVVLARLEGLSQREDAAARRGMSIAVPRSALPLLAKGEVYLADLVGLSVVDREGRTLGRVQGVMETGAHPVLRVADGVSAERLIPLVPAHVDAIELDAGRIVVEWPSDY
jgi:16S rRNA processing protein RimM